MSEISKIKQRLFDSVKKSYKKGTPVKFAPKPEKPMTPPGKKKKVKKKAEGGSLSPKQKTIAAKAGNPNKIEGIDFEVLRKGDVKKAKYGGKITYRMTGGQVVDSTYDQQSKHPTTSQ